MASKTTKKARKAGVKNNAPIEKDDGTRWIVVRDGLQVYPGSGIVKAQAERLAQDLLEPASIKQVK